MAIHINVRRVGAEICGLLVFTIGLAALVGALTGLQSVYRWGDFIDLAMSTAIGCMVLGLGILVVAWRMERSGDEATRLWLPTLAGLVVAIVALLLWQGLLGRERRQFRHLIHQQTAIVQDVVTSQMALRISPLSRMATLWEQQGKPREAVWRVEAQYDVMHIGGYQAIAWVDPTLSVRWVVPSQGNEAFLDKTLADNPRQRQGLELARERHVVTATQPFEFLPGLTGFQVAVPIATGQAFMGWIVGFFHAQELFDLLFKNTASNFSLVLFINDEEFYGRYDASRKYEDQWGQETVFSLHGVPWRVRVWPQPGPLTEMFSPLPDLVLATGMVTAILLMVSVHFGQTASLGARQVERSNRELQHEIAERRRTEQALQASHRFLQTVLDALPAHMAILDGTGVIVAVNAAWERFVAAHDQLTQTHGLELNYLDIVETIVGSERRAVEAISTGIREVMAHQCDAFHYEYAFPHPDEVQHWFLMHVIRFDAPEGVRIVVTHENITEVKQAEAELKRQREALYQTEKLTVMGSLMAGVAHELNNPLAAALVQADLLREEAEGGTLAEQAQTLAQGVERCVNVVRTFLAFARQQPPQRVSVALNTVVEEALALLSYSLRMDEIEIEQRLDEDLPDLWADPHQLHQVIVNLAANAHQALRDVAPPRHMTISTSTDATRQRVILEVADTGPGIAAELQSQIFEPFFTTKPTGVGTGIGLSFCQSIVESHGGVITVRSQPGQGAVFRVELPVESVTALATAEPLSQVPASARHIAILVVDDEDGIRRALARLLRRDGHEVDTAANGRLALEALRARTYDLILCDWRMPELDGPGLYRELERHMSHMLHRVIFLTGDVFSPETQAFLDRSSGLYLHKPFNAATCRRVIAQALHHLPET